MEGIYPDNLPASWNALDKALGWAVDRRNAAGYEVRGWGRGFAASEEDCIKEYGEHPAAAIQLEFHAMAKRTRGDIRMVRCGWIGKAWRCYLLAERVNTALPLARGDVEDRLAMKEIKLYDPPLLVADAADEKLLKKLIIFERKDFGSRRASRLAGMGAPILPGTVLTRGRTERVADEHAMHSAKTAQLMRVGVIKTGTERLDRELADQVEYVYWPTQRGQPASGGVLLNHADMFAPRIEQGYDAIVLRDKAEVPFQQLQFDASITDDEERLRIVESLSREAGVRVRMP